MKSHDEKFLKLGLNIAYHRKLKRMSQLDLAERAGISRTHISNIEAPNMPTAMSIETLFDIADALDVPASQLLDFTK